jgi:hypothetical protein
MVPSGVVPDPPFEHLMRLSDERGIFEHTEGVATDEATGEGFDALTPGGRNTNRGAESTLAMVSTLQHGVTMSV